MSNSKNDPAKVRPIFCTEKSCCKAVVGGTGIAVVAFFTNKQPDLSLLQTSLHKLQTTHPLLKSKLQVDPQTRTFSFLIPPSPALHLERFDLQSSINSFEKILEDELNRNAWEEKGTSSSGLVDVMYVSVYALDGGKWAVAIRAHMGACDRTAGMLLLRDLLRLMTNGGDDQVVQPEEDDEVKMGIEEYIPTGNSNKGFWARRVCMMGYAMNSLRTTNLDFVGPSQPRSSRLLRFFIDSHHTAKLLQGCKRRDIKLCGVLSAAGLMAARLCKGIPDGKWEKYAVVTLTDCRKHLEPALSSHHVGFYHSAIVNTHDMQGGEELWELSRRTYNSFRDAMNSNKHFSDMADLNFLMCRAIENPSLTPSSSLRTSFISVFEDPVIDETDDKCAELGIEDYVGCASTHGVGPSIAIFDTIRDGKLDCACVYPSPLHSRQQMQELIDNMKKILVDCSE